MGLSTHTAVQPAQVKDRSYKERLQNVDRSEECTADGVGDCRWR